MDISWAAAESSVAMQQNIFIDITIKKETKLLEYLVTTTLKSHTVKNIL